ncbi:MAG TPA: outer membrane beta-barrel protein [Bacteroidales bacterium]|nr:outer membrane beta-barrel protein [Bacteroidales bacterium]
MKSLVNRSGTLLALRLGLIVVLVLIIQPKALSQEDYCLSKLKRAQELFDSGLIEEIPFMLDSCLKTGFDKEQTIQAYRLLIQVYLFDYNQEKAEGTMLALLTRFPEYKIQSNDPVEFVNLYNQFKTRPRYSFSINPGINMSNVSVLEQYSTGNLNGLKPDYNPKGINGGVILSFEKYFGSRAWITTGLGYSFASYEVKESMNFDRELLSFSEKMQFAHLPIYFNFSFGESKRVVPYIFAGGQLNYLIKADGELNRRSLIENSTTTDLKGTAKDITKSRNAEGFSALGGMGVRFKIAAGYLKANLYYTKGLTDYVKDDLRFSDSENLYYYNHIDDRIRLDFFNFSVSYSYIFYKTSKKTIPEKNQL